MDDGTESFLSKQLYPDLKSWIVSLGRKLKNPVRRAQAEIFHTPDSLLESLKSGEVRDGDLVTLECKPAHFGPFLRDHFLSPVIGNKTDQRLGPPLQHAHPALGILAQTTSHLQPVGLYPPVGEGIHQACLYPSDAQACGFLGMIPGVNNVVTYIPALLPSRHTPYAGMPCNLTGVMRLVDAEILTDFGITPEDYEELRQSGEVWFLDATIDASECNPLNEGVTTELWGGLYASGHLEISEGELSVERLIEGFEDAFSNQGFDPNLTQNKVKREEIVIFDKGIRSVIDWKSAIFSVHMDAELCIDFKDYRRKFDSFTKTLLDNISTICMENSVKLENESDLDFTYTDSTDAFSVLRSLSANEIQDPLAISIRDWHRSRGA